MADFLKKIVGVVDNHPSTQGYEILSEPHVDNVSQWSQDRRVQYIHGWRIKKCNSKNYRL